MPIVLTGLKVKVYECAIREYTADSQIAYIAVCPAVQFMEFIGYTLSPSTDKNKLAGKRGCNMMLIVRIKEHIQQRICPDDIPFSLHESSFDVTNDVITTTTMPTFSNMKR